MGGGRARRERAKKKPRAIAADWGARVARATLGLALVGTALVVDATTDNAFDAPKRLLALVAIAVAAAAVFGWRGTGRAPALAWWRGASPLRRAVLLLALAAALAAGLAAILSPRREVALDACRTLLLFALLLPLGSSRALERPRPLLALFLAAAGINAAVSLLQASGAYSPFDLRVWGGREGTGAFAGNVGYLAIALSFATVTALGTLVAARSPVLRIVTAAAALLFIAAVVVNQNLTSLMSLGAGVLVLSVGSFGRRAWLPLALILVSLAAGVLLYRPLRARASQVVAAARAGDWDRLLTYRGGPWAAAVEMTRERPLAGWGPGTFGQEFVPHRLAAEIRAGRRFVNPLVTSSYAEAHSDYVQPFAEAGIVAGVAAAGAAVLLLLTLFTTLPRMDGARRAEAVLVASLLVAGATAALTWFPLQRPITAVPLLLAAGRAWTLSAPEDGA